MKRIVTPAAGKTQGLTVTTILQIVPELDTGGAERSAVEVGQALTQAGARSLIVSQGGRMLPEVTRSGTEHIFLPVRTKNPLRIAANGRALAKLIRIQNVDIIHARSRAPAWSAFLASRQTGVPMVTTYHGAYGNREPFKNVYNSVMARGARVIANSQFTADHVRRCHGTGDDRLRIIYRGVDLSEFDLQTVKPERLEALKEKWQIADPARVVLHPARLSRLKGQAVVIEAMQILLTQPGYEDAVVIMAGDDQGRTDYRSKLRRRIDRLGLAEQVRLVGHCDDIAAACLLAKIVLVTSVVPETFGRTSIEAQAMGCPVIASNIGAPPETVLAEPHVPADEITGWLVPPNAPVKLAAALGQALDLSADERLDISRRARQNATTRFSDDQMKLQTLAVYDEILGTALKSAYENARPVR